MVQQGVSHCFPKRPLLYLTRNHRAFDTIVSHQYWARWAWYPRWTCTCKPFAASLTSSIVHWVQDLRPSLAWSTKVSVDASGIRVDDRLHATVRKGGGWGHMPPPPKNIMRGARGEQKKSNWLKANPEVRTMQRRGMNERPAPPPPEQKRHWAGNWQPSLGESGRYR